MNAISRLSGYSTSLPGPVTIALARAGDLAVTAPKGLDIIAGISGAMAGATEEGKPVDPDVVDQWRRQIDWVLEHLELELDELRSLVRDTGVLTRRD